MLFRVSAGQGHCAEFLLPTHTTQGSEQIGERGLLLAAIPGTLGESQMAMAFLMKPQHDQAVQHQRHRRGASHGLLGAVGRVLQPQQLFAVFEGHLDGPSRGVGRKNLSSLPVQTGAVEHLVGTFAQDIAHQDDGQEPVLARFVVPGLAGLDLVHDLHGLVNQMIVQGCLPQRGVEARDGKVEGCKVRVQFLDEYGKLITESLTDYTRKAVHKNYASLADFLTTWNAAARKQTIIELLAAQGVFLDELAEQVGRDYDPFDLVCHVAFDQPPLTRRERADGVRKRNVFGKYGAKARAVLEALIQKYADSGISSVESLEILKVNPLRTFGTPVEIVNLFGGRDNYLAAIRELEIALYQEAA